MTKINELLKDEENRLTTVLSEKSVEEVCCNGGDEANLSVEDGAQAHQSQPENELAIFIEHPPIATRKVRVRINRRTKGVPDPIVPDVEE